MSSSPFVTQPQMHEHPDVRVSMQQATRSVGVIQVRPRRATTVPDVFVPAVTEAVDTFGFDRAMVAIVDHGNPTADQTPTPDDPRSAELRRRLLSRPVPLTSGYAEANLLRAAEGRCPPGSGASVLESALALNDWVAVAVVPEHRAVVAFVTDRRDGLDHARAHIDLLGRLVTAAVESVALRARLSDESDEARHLATSAQALVREALTAETTLVSAQSHGALYTAAKSPSGPADVPLDELLSPLEISIARLMSHGCSNREIGIDLFMSPDTVKDHVGRIARKLRAGNRVEAVARYVAAGGAF